MNLPDSITINRATTTASAGGGQIRAMAAAYTDLPCLVQTASAKAVADFARMGITIKHVIYLDTTVVIMGGDVGVIATGSHAGTYSINGHDDMGGQGRWFALYALRQS
ncbi:MAG: hypothetical protein WC069_06925 [Candidatus Shapirobacteria bacterium]